MLKFKACPKCKGDIVLDRDQYGWYEQCIQCGYLRNIESVVEVKQPRGEEKEEEKKVPSRSRKKATGKADSVSAKN